MAEKESGGSGWAAFLAGIVLVAVIGLGFYAYTGGFERREVAETPIEMPDVTIEGPDIDLPDPPPPPEMPPQAEPAQQ